MGKLGLRQSVHSRIEELEQTQGLDSQPPRSNYFKRKRESIIRTYEEPVLPKLCLILFVSMLVLTAAMLLVEVSAFIRFPLDPGRFLNNLSITCFTIWGIYAVLLGVCCTLGMRNNAANYWKRIPEQAEQTEAERQRSKRAIHRLNGRYWLYLKIALAGLLVWLVFRCLIFLFF